MKNKFLILLLTIFCLFSIFRIVVSEHNVLFDDKIAYKNFEQVLGDLRYYLNDKEINNAKNIFRQIDKTIDNLNSNVNKISQDNEKITNIFDDSELISYATKLNNYLNQYTKKYIAEKEAKKVDLATVKKENTVEDTYLDTQEITENIEFDSKKQEVQDRQLNNLKGVLSVDDYEKLKSIITTMNEEKKFLDPQTHQEILSILLKHSDLDAYLILGQLCGRFEILGYYEIENGNIQSKSLKAITIPDINNEQDKKYKKLINTEILLLDVVYSKYFKGFFIFSDGEKGLITYASDFQNNKRGYLGIDPSDFGAEVSNDFEKTRFYHSIMNELSRVILLSNFQIDYTKVASVSDIDDFETIKSLSKKDSYLMQFYIRFWNDIMYKDSKLSSTTDSRKYFYLRHEDEFMSEYVSQDPFKDIIESMTRFLLEAKPIDTQEKFDKIRFFYEFSELTDIKKRIDLNIKHLEE